VHNGGGMGERGIKCTIHNSPRRCEGFLRQTLLQEAEMLRWVAHAATLVILLRARRPQHRQTVAQGETTTAEFEVATVGAFVPPPAGRKARVAFGTRGGPGSSDPGQASWNEMAAEGPAWGSIRRLELSDQRTVVAGYRKVQDRGKSACGSDQGAGARHAAASAGGAFQG